MPSNHTTLSPEEYNRLDRFLDAFNQIEQHLRYALRADSGRSFAGLVDDYADNNQAWGHRAGRRLRIFARTRNSLVHTRGLQDEEFISVPVASVVAEIERFRDELLDEEAVLPRHQKKVVTIRPDLSLAGVLKLVESQQISQFPVYDGDTFQALLTENGITRWLAGHTSAAMTLVEFADVSVADLLAQEEIRDNVSFVSRRTTTQTAADKFFSHPFLEAILITESGKRSQKPLGIITRWDILNQSD